MTGPSRLDPRQDVVRAVRAGLLTVPAVGFATLAHMSVDSCVSVVAVLLAVGLCWPAAVVLLKAQRRVLALVGWLMLAQGLTHLLLEQFCGDAAPGHTGLIGHLMMGVSPTMLAMHAGSALFTGVLFGRADAGLWMADRLVRSGARALRRLRSTVVAVGLPQAPLAAGVGTGVRQPRVLWEAGQPPRRGPPEARAL